MTMTKEEQRIKIAEACGIHVCGGCNRQIDIECCWCGDPIKNHGYGDGHSPIPMGCTCGYTDADERKLPEPNCPDYLNDLNAMHEAENTLTVDQRFDYMWKLDDLAPDWLITTDSSYQPNWDMVFIIAHATAAQRAEAFLKALKLWK